MQNQKRRQRDHKFKANLENIATPCLETLKKEKEELMDVLYLNSFFLAKTNIYP